MWLMLNYSFSQKKMRSDIKAKNILHAHILYFINIFYHWINKINKYSKTSKFLRMMKKCYGHLPVKLYTNASNSSFLTFDMRLYICSNLKILTRKMKISIYVNISHT